MSVDLYYLKNTSLPKTSILCPILKTSICSFSNIFSEVVNLHCRTCNNIATWFEKTKTNNSDARFVERLESVAMNTLKMEVSTDCLPCVLSMASTIAQEENLAWPPAGESYTPAAAAAAAASAGGGVSRDVSRGMSDNGEGWRGLLEQVELILLRRIADGRLIALFQLGQLYYEQVNAPFWPRVSQGRGACTKKKIICSALCGDTKTITTTVSLFISTANRFR